MSKYSHRCPVCGAIIPPRGFRWEPSFPCPTCGAELKFDSKNMWVIWLGSFLGAPFLAWHLGYGGLKFVIVAICAALLLLSLGMSIEGLVFAPGYKRVAPSKSKRFDGAVSLHLTDKPNSGKKASS
jgi:hypothetical protein